MRRIRAIAIAAFAIAVAPAALEARTAPDPTARAEAAGRVRRLALQVHRRAAIGDERIGEMMRQVQRIWEPHGFEVVWTAPGATDSAADIVLRVVLVERGPDGQPAPGGLPTIGWIEFLAPDRPRDVVNVSVGAARRLMRAARLGGRPLSALPPAVADRFLAQALGRSLAHEIGHFVFASSDHSDGGLMRTSFTPHELLAPDLDGFEVPSAWLGRLRSPAVRAGPAGDCTIERLGLIGW